MQEYPFFAFLYFRNWRECLIIYEYFLEPQKFAENVCMRVDFFIKLSTFAKDLTKFDSDLIYFQGLIRRKLCAIDPGKASEPSKLIHIIRQTLAALAY